MRVPGNRARWRAWYNVALALVRSTDDKVLLIKRSGAEYSGFWGLPGGKFGFSEAGRETVVRELVEETGLAPEQYSAPQFVGLGLERLERYIEKERRFKLKARWQLYYFAAVCSGSASVTSNCAWVSEADLLSTADIIPSVVTVVQMDRERSQGRFDFFFMEDTIRSRRHRLSLTSIHVDTFRRQTSVEGP